MRAKNCTACVRMIKKIEDMCWRGVRGMEMRKRKEIDNLEFYARVENLPPGALKISKF